MHQGHLLKKYGGIGKIGAEPSFTQTDDVIMADEKESLISHKD